MTITFNRSFFLFVGVVLAIVVVAGLVYGWMRNGMLEHKATVQALEVVLESEQLKKTIGQPVTIGAWVEGEGFLGSEDKVEVRVPLKGPMAEVVMVMKAEKEDSGWVFQTLRIESLEGAKIADMVDEADAQKKMAEQGALLARLGDGRAQAGTGNYAEAIEIYAEVLEEDEKNAEALRLWGIAAYRMEDYEVAEEKLDQALSTMVSQETDGDYAEDTATEASWAGLIENWATEGEIGPLERWLEAVETLGLIYLNNERSTLCIETFFTVTQKASVSRRVAKAHEYLAECYLLQDLQDKAIYNFRQACIKDQDLVGACKRAGLPIRR